MRYSAAIDNQLMSVQKRACVCDLCLTFGRGVIITLGRETVKLCGTCAIRKAEELSK